MAILFCVLITMRNVGTLFNERIISLNTEFCAVSFFQGISMYEMAFKTDGYTCTISFSLCNKYYYKECELKVQSDNYNRDI